MRSSSSKQQGVAPENGSNGAVVWETRPGGMLVQRRDDGAGVAGPLIKVKVLYGTAQHEISVPAQSTFGELKRLLSQLVGLEPEEQRLLFRGKEKDKEERMHMAGVKDMSKLVLLEDPASRERKLEEMKKNERIARACEAVVRIRSEADKHVEKVSGLQASVYAGKKVEEKELLVLTELLMVQLLKLDGVEADGEAKVQRKIEVRRIQSYVEILDALKARNSNPINGSKTVSVSTQWETFDSGFGSLTAPPPMPSSTSRTEDWEQFD
ncbi:putative Ubiquitin-like domain, BAG domain, Ubiquitin-like domain superfamily [Dioscorea sansibarensis]